MAKGRSYSDIKKWAKYQTAKEYRKWLLLLGLCGIFLLLIEGLDISNLVLYETAVIILWYTRETYDLKQISNKQLTETRRQIGLQLRPYLRIQWSEGPTITVYDIVNEGEGAAIDVKFKPLRFRDQNFISEYQIKSRPLIAKSKPTSVSVLELNNPRNLVTGSGIKGYLDKKTDFHYLIQASYKDIDDNRYKVIFQSDPTYNDRFKIIEQKRLK